MKRSKTAAGGPVRRAAALLGRAFLPALAWLRPCGLNACLTATVGALLLALLPATAAPAERRNVILFIGDGMGVSTVTAARIFAGQSAGADGEEHSLSFERFPHLALVKTYTTDRQVPDSAGTMTAIITGAKTRSGVLSVSREVAQGDCAAGLERPLTTLLERAEEAGFLTGIVTTTTITHATPAAAYAHAADRNWEYDALLPKDAAKAGCRDLARQLVEFAAGDGIEVMLGGGRAHFLGADQPDPERPHRTGLRSDGRNLVQQWLSGDPRRAYVWRLEQLEALEDGPQQVLGLFEPGHLPFEADRDKAHSPSLARMTEFALRRLRGRGPGFFLLVEGGRIDHAHHFGNAYRALVDTVALDAAVALAEAMTDPADTLILVTADHSHTLTIGGYPRRGNAILGKVETQPGVLAKDPFGNPYTTLSYANGPGWRKRLPDLTETDTEAPDFIQLAAFPTFMQTSEGPVLVETHGGEDVAAYAKGLNADALRGLIEQNLLHDLMFEALFDRPPSSRPAKGGGGSATP